MVENMTKTIGEMNGGWRTMFKVFLVVAPLTFIWASWVTASILTTISNCWSIDDHLVYADKIQNKFDDHPPPQLLDRVGTIESDITTIKVTLARIEQKLE